MDEKITKQIQEWLDTPADERDIQQGANLMLKLNRNRVLYQNVLHKGVKMIAKVEYELKKYLRLRLDNMTTLDVIRLEKTAVPVIEKLIAEHGEKESAEFAGKRTDHEELPQEIQALWDNNFELYAKIKNVFEELKARNSLQPCDRYELLKVLDEADKTYRSNLAAYDSYVVGQSAPIADGATADDNPAELATKINNARKYISSNKEKLTTLIAAEDEKVAQLREKMQERVDIILTAGVPFTADQQAELEKLGIIFK